MCEKVRSCLYGDLLRPFDYARVMRVQVRVECGRAAYELRIRHLVTTQSILLTAQYLAPAIYYSFD